jgi:hypothetical protein
LHGNIGKKRVVCKFMNWYDYRTGDVVGVGFSREKVHFFDPDTTGAIRVEGRA